MGSSASKAARDGVRKFPTRPPGGAVPTSGPRRKLPSKPGAGPAANDGGKDAAIRADAMDPDFVPGGFSQRLQQMGVVQPSPTYSPSSTAGPNVIPQSMPQSSFAPRRSNPTLTALEARRRLQQEAEEDFVRSGRLNAQGRRFLDMRTVVDAMKLRDSGSADPEIERRLNIQPGLLKRLGDKGVLLHVNSAN